MGLFSGSDSSKKVDEEYIEKHLGKDDLYQWGFNPFGEGSDGSRESLWKAMNLNVDMWPFDVLRNGMDRTSLGWDDSMGTTITGDQIKEEGVTGLYNYTTPTDIQFAQCMDSQGLSVWDANGWWRCLFPKNIIQQNLPNLQDAESAMILTKEKVENDLTHKFGLYFSDYTKYLLWKSQINKIIEERRTDQKQKQLKQEQDTEIQFPTTTPEDVMLRDATIVQQQHNDKKSVVGKSEVFKSKMTSDGANEETKETKTYYNDGSVVLKTQMKVTPKNGGQPRIENHERVLKQGRDESSGGFPFWSRKK